MKVAQFIGDCGPGGAETVAFSIATEMLSMDFVNESIIYVKNIAEAEWCESKIKGTGVEVVVLPPSLMKYWSIKNIFAFAIGFSTILKDDGIDVLHSHMYPQILRGAVSAKLAGIKHIGTLHDVYSIQDKPSRIRWLKVATMLGTQLVAVSEDMNNTYHDISKKFTFCRLPKDNPVVIYNGVDTDKYYPRDCNLTKPFHLISVGRLTAVKNYMALLVAMQKVIEHGVTNILLTIIGDGEDREQLESMAEKYLPHHVDFLGSRDDVPELLCEADAFVLVSKSEGLSCSILEAMACGLPILATNVGGNNELVEQGVNGFLLPSGDTDAIAQAIFDMVAGEYDLNEMGYQSKRIIENTFSMDKMIKSYVDLYI